MNAEDTLCAFPGCGESRSHLRHSAEHDHRHRCTVEDALECHPFRTDATFAEQADHAANLRCVASGMRAEGDSWVTGRSIPTWLELAADALDAKEAEIERLRLENRLLRQDVEEADATFEEIEKEWLDASQTLDGDTWTPAQIVAPFRCRVCRGLLQNHTVKQAQECRAKLPPQVRTRGECKCRE